MGWDRMGGYGISKGGEDRMGWDGEIKGRREEGGNG
jgi:hypothetical protein